MPNSTTYYPKLNTLVTAAAIPGELAPVELLAQGIIDKLLRDLRYTNYILEHSPDGDTAFHSLTLKSKQIRLPLFGTGMDLVFFEGEDDYSDFPISMDWRWPILRYTDAFEEQGFSYLPEAFLDILLKLADIDSTEEAVEEIISVFLSGGTAPYENAFRELTESFEGLKNQRPAVDAELDNIKGQLKIVKDKVKVLLDNNLKSLIEIAKNYKSDPDPDMKLILDAVKSGKASFEKVQEIADVDIDIYKILINAVLKDAGDPAETFRKLFELFERWLGNITKEDIEDLLIPQFGWSLSNISMGLEFPRAWVVPMTETNTPGIYEEDPDTTKKAGIIFRAGDVSYHTTSGFDINIAEDNTTSSFSINTASNNNSIEIPRCLIPSIGIQLDISGVKLDLSRTKNIAEATADDRPVEFIGAYIEKADIFLPSKWFKFDKNKSTLVLYGEELLLGTYGVSGVIGIRAAPGMAARLNGNLLLEEGGQLIIDPTSGDDDKVFDTGDTVELLPSGGTAAAPASAGSYELKEGGTITVDHNSLLVSYEPSDGVLSYEFGSGDSTWKIGFKTFYLKLWQNTLQESDVRGFLEVPNFKRYDRENDDWKTEDLLIDIGATFPRAGGFSLTAIPEEPVCFGIKGVFFICLNSLEIGNDGDKTYLEVAGEMGFPKSNILSKYLKEPISIKKLRIYADGSYEFEGGSVSLARSIPIDLGVVQVTVSNMTMGAETLERGGAATPAVAATRSGASNNYKFIGFDFGLSTGGGTVDLQGDGFKLYYNSDGSDIFLRIAGIGVDLMIPGTATAETAALIVKGYLSIRGEEFTGAVSVELPKMNIKGGAVMRMYPKRPAFLIDAYMTLGTPINIFGTGLGIYEFRGLFGFDYKLEELSEGAAEDPDKLFELYGKKVLNPLSLNSEKGIHTGKMKLGAETAATPIVIGAGMSVGTVGDAGRAASMMAFLFLSTPELLMVSGKANVLSERVSAVAKEEPPFSAYLALTRQYISIGMAADYKVPKAKEAKPGAKPGAILELEAEARMAFFFRNPSAWYIHFGTKENPNKARLLKEIFKVEAYAYLMLSSRGMSTGAGIRYAFEKKYGPASVSAKAYLDVFAEISFRKPQISGGIALGGSIDVKVFGQGLGASIAAYLNATAPRPFIIRGGAEVCVSIRLTFFKFEKCFSFDFVWELNKASDAEAIGIFPELPSNPDQEAAWQNPASAYHLGSGETYELGKYLTSLPTTFPAPADAQKIFKTIPIDSRINVQFKKPVNPVSDALGGKKNAATGFREVLAGNFSGYKVTHEFTLRDVSILVYQNNNWVDYKPYAALAGDAVLGPSIDRNQLKIGNWQAKSKEHNDFSILSSTPFDFMDQTAGQTVPERLGVSAATLFCPAVEETMNCVVFKDAGTLPPSYWSAFRNLRLHPGKAPATEVVAPANGFGISHALAFSNHEGLRIIIPEAAPRLEMKLSGDAQRYSVYFYTHGIPEGTDGQGNPLPAQYLLAEKRGLTKGQLKNTVVYDDPDAPVQKVVIKAECADPVELQQLKERIATLVMESKVADEDPDKKTLQDLDILRDQLKELQGLCCPETENADEGKGDKDKEIKALEDRLRELDRSIAELENRSKSCDQQQRDLKDLAECLKSKQKSKPVINIDDLLKFPEKRKMDARTRRRFENLHRKLADNPAKAKRSVDGLLKSAADGTIWKAEGKLVTKDTLELQKILEALKNAELSKEDCLLRHAKNKNLDPRLRKACQTLHGRLKESPKETQVMVTELAATVKNMTSQVKKDCEKITKALKEARGEHKKISGTLKKLLTQLEEAQDEKSTLACHSFLYQVCYLTEEQLWFNSHIPSQAAIDGDYSRMLEATTKVIAPVFRPEEYYFVKVHAEEAVNGIVQPQKEFFFPFQTGRPLGHFAEDRISSVRTKRVEGEAKQLPPKGAPGDPQDYDSNKELPENTLRYYLDDLRCYPSANGNILNQKKLYYEDAKLKLFFTQPYAKHFFSDWPDGQGGLLRAGEMEVIVQDPTENSINDSSINPLPIAPLTTNVVWKTDSTPLVPLRLTMLQNMAGASPCLGTQGDIARPFVKWPEVSILNLQPNKLYNAVIKNSYAANGKDFTSETVHQYPFQTSRYAKLADQIGSYLQEDETGKISMPAVFRRESPAPHAQLLRMARGEDEAAPSGDVEKNLIKTFASRFQRLLYGELKIDGLENPDVTEFNFITNVKGETTAILICSAEPLNDPRIPETDLINTVRLEVNGEVWPNSRSNKKKTCFPVFSSDRSCVLLIPAKRLRPGLDVKCTFDYLEWDGATYQPVQTYLTQSL